MALRGDPLSKTHRLRCLVTTFVTLLAFACEDETRLTAVRVHFDADSVVRERAARIELFVRPDEGLPPTYERGFSLMGNPAEASFPVTLPIVPKDGDSTRRFHLEARLLDTSGTTIGHRVARGGFVRGEIVDVEIRFTAACLDGTECCPGHTCIDGMCRPPPCISACDAPDRVAVRAEQRQVAVYGACGTEYEEVPDAAMRLEPAPSGRRWLVLLSGRLTHESPSELTTALRYFVGEELGGEIGGEGQQAPFQHFLLLEEGAEARDVRVELRAPTGTMTRVDDLRVIAVLVDAAAIAHEARDDARHIVETMEWQSFFETTFTPDVEDDYVIFLLASSSEEPSGSSTGLQWRVGNDIPVPTRAFGYGRGPFQPFIHVRIERLRPEPFRMSAEGHASRGTPFTAGQARVLVLRAGALDVAYAVDAASVFPDGEPIVMSALDVEAPAEEPELRLLVQTLRMVSNCDSATISHRISTLTANDRVLHRSAHETNACGGNTPDYGGFSLVTHEMPIHFRVKVEGFAAANSEAWDSSLYSIRIP